MHDFYGYILKVVQCTESHMEYDVSTSSIEVSHLSWNIDDLGFEELRDVECQGRYYDRQQVFGEASPDGIGIVHSQIVVQRIMHCNIPAKRGETHN